MFLMEQAFKVLFLLSNQILESNCFLLGSLHFKEFLAFKKCSVAKKQILKLLKAQHILSQWLTVNIKFQLLCICLSKALFENLQQSKVYDLLVHFEIESYWNHYQAQEFSPPILKGPINPLLHLLKIYPSKFLYKHSTLHLWHLFYPLNLYWIYFAIKKYRYFNQIYWHRLQYHHHLHLSFIHLLFQAMQ